VALCQSLLLTGAKPIGMIGGIDNWTARLECALPNFRLVGTMPEVTGDCGNGGGHQAHSLPLFTNKRGLLEILLEEKFSLLIGSIRIATVHQNGSVMSLCRVVQAYFNFASQLRSFTACCRPGQPPYTLP
jgi:hypothetical protein